jgi:glutamate-ammonia-ligase adenylyltransferase
VANPTEVDPLQDLSRWAVDLLAADRDAAGVLADLDTAVDVAGALDGDDLAARYRREILRIAGRDLGGLDDLTATTKALSEAAAGAWEAALRLVGPMGGPVAVVGMGKFGATELNYASDVDVVLAAVDPIAAERGLRSAVELVRRCIRVDLDLRPEGRDGALVRTVAGYANHWERWSEPWERQALLKARPIAGDPEVGAAWADAARDALWERPFAADDIRAVRAIKARSEAEVARRGNEERDVKRGLGGIRDVEFAVQLLQLVHGGDDETLREPRTLAALRELAAGGYVADADALGLAAAYTELRRVEHRLQLVDLRPAHVLPRDARALERLARSLGDRSAPDRSAAEAMLERLRHQRAVARDVHERLWFRPLLGAFAGRERALAAFGFADAERTEEAVAELTRGLTRTSRLMQQLLPLLLEWLSLSPDPDLGLLGLRRLASGPGRATALAEAFRDSPEGARRLCAVLGTSEQLGDLLVRNPDMVGFLADDRALAPRSAAELAGLADAAAAWRVDTEDRRLALKRFSDREGLRIAAGDVLGLVDTATVGTALTDLASAALRSAVDAVAREVDLAVVALGRFGGGELSYPSDLDLVFVAGGDRASVAEAERAVVRMFRFLGGGTPKLYDVDPDLRPEGRDGPLVRSLEAWSTYVSRWAEPWERLAWVKARPVAGDPGLGAALVEDVLAPFVWERPVTDAERLALRRVKVRVEAERIRPGDDRDFHLKLGPGGLTDVEFCTQLLQLEHGVRATGTATALELLAAAGVLDGDEHAALGQAHAFLEEVRNRLFLVTGDAGDALPARPDHLARLAASLGTTPRALRETHRRVTRRARRVVERRFFGRP